MSGSQENAPISPCIAFGMARRDSRAWAQIWFRMALRYAPLTFPLNKEYKAVHPLVRVSKEMTGQEDGDESLRRKHQTLDPQKSFIGVKRVQIGKKGEVVRLQIQGYDRGQYDGYWVTEYTKYGSRTIHCLPADHLNALSGQHVSPDKLLTVANFPILQRWVGVQYHPETEIESHYGEMSIGKCYDLEPRHRWNMGQP